MKRQRVIDEIISSEETYCASLERLVNEVVIPLLTKQQLNTASVQERQPTHTRENSITTLQRLSSFTGFASLPKRFEISIKPNEHAMAFSNIREILTLSKQLLTALKQEGAQCGAVILAHRQQLEHVYELYVGNYETNLVTLAEIHRRPGFSDYINQQLNGMQLGSLAIQPVQRVPRYLLLLKELYKCSGNNGSELPMLKKAISSLQDVCKFINAAKGHLEQVEILLELEEHCGLEGLVKPRRCLLMEGTLYKVCRRKNKPFMFWLFTDMMMYGVPITKIPGRSQTFVVSHQFSLEFVQIRDVDYMDTSTNTSEPALEFRSPKKSFLVLCEDEVKKSLWLQHFQASKAEVLIRPERQRKRSAMRKIRVNRLRRVKNEKNAGDGGKSNNDALALCVGVEEILEQRSGHIAPLWVQDHLRSSCQKCNHGFTFFNRRHHCRMCGALVCNDCSSNRAHIPTETRPVRVCDPCLNQIRRGGGVVQETPNDGTTEVLNPFMSNILEMEEEAEVEEMEAVENETKETEETEKTEVTEVTEETEETEVTEVTEVTEGTEVVEEMQTRRLGKKKRGGRGKTRKKNRKTITDMDYVAFMTRKRRGSSKFSGMTSMNANSSNGDG